MAQFSDFTFGGLKQRVFFRLLQDPRYTDPGVPTLPGSAIGVAVNKGIAQQYIYNRVATNVLTTNTFQLSAPDPNAGLYSQFYPLPTGTLWVDYASYDDVPLQPMTEKELIATGIEKATFVGNSRWYNIQDQQDGSKTMVLFGRPDRTVLLKVYGGVSPAYLVNDADIPQINPVFADPIELYACWYLLQGQPEESQRAQEFFQLWQKQRNEVKVIARLDRNWRIDRWRDYP
jgi:hypothetical protein